MVTKNYDKCFVKIKITLACKFKNENYDCSCYAAPL